MMEQQTPIIAQVPANDLEKKLLEEKINSVKELLLQANRHEREHFETVVKYETQLQLERFGARDKEVAHQALIYEDRLRNLNHENERIQKILDTSIPREVFDRENDQRKKEISTNQTWITKQEGLGQGKISFSQYVSWVISIILFLYLVYTAINK